MDFPVGTLLLPLKCLQQVSYRGKKKKKKKEEQEESKIGSIKHLSTIFSFIVREIKFLLNFLSSTVQKNS
jgi:hypothetical protein